jgi:ribosomal RNA-processing protein 9
MPDSFFASSKPRKRKRSGTGQDAGPQGSAKRISRNNPPPLAKPRLGKTKSKVNGARKRPRNADEEIDSDHTNEGDGGGVEDMELRVSTDDGEEFSGEEDVDETPAEKRLRLAELYLESVKEGLGE